MQKNEKRGFLLSEQIRIPVVVLALLFAFALPSVANVFDDAKLITIVNRDISVREALEQVKKQSGVSLMFQSGIVENKPHLSLDLRKVTLQKALDVICPAAGLQYVLKDDYVLITKVRTEKQALPKQKITGIVTDEAGEPLIGAAVYVENGNHAKGVITDYNGRYEIKAALDEALVFSYVGMAKQVLAVSGNVMNVTLKEESKMLGDVVVTGYQTISKERATGAFDIIKEKALEKPSVTIADRLVGKVAGVQATTTADGEISFKIRGNGTLQSDAEPLIVVDGFPISTGFASINPNDVANISILKDAAAASIWGARASNGVIVVTTKKGNKAKGLTVEVDAQLRIGNKVDIDYLRNMMSSTESIEYQKKTFGTYLADPVSPSSTPASFPEFSRAYQYRYNQAAVLYNKYSKNEISESEYNTGLSSLAALDNKRQISDELLKRPIYQQYNVTLSGATARMTNYVSMLYAYDTTRYQGSDSRKFQFDYRGNIKLLKWLEMDVSAMALYRKNNTSGATASDIAELAPYDMVLNQDGSYTDMSYIMQYADGINHMLNQYDFPYSDWSYNLLREVNGRSMSNKTMNNRFQVGLRATILEGLSVSTKFQLEHVQKDSRQLYTDETYYVRDVVDRFTTLDLKKKTATAHIEKGSILNEGKYATDAYNWRNQLDFNRTFAERHAINAVAGVEVRQSKINNRTFAPIYGYDDNYLTSRPIQEVVVTNCFNERKVSIPVKSMFRYSLQRYFSAFTNLAYTFDDKYSISGSFRTDASNFITDDPKYRYSPFWSVGFSWNMMHEDFMKSQHWLDYLTPRITYGCNGNANTTTSMVPLITMAGVSDITQEQYARISSYGNPQMSWEQTHVVNFGIDWSMFGGKFYGKIDVYNKKGTDIMADVSVPIASGQLKPGFNIVDAKITANAAEVTNRGFEMELGSSQDFGAGVHWDGNVTLAYNKNKVDKLYLGYVGHDKMRDPIPIEGYDINGLWAYQYAGLRERTDDEGNTYKVPNIYVDNEGGTSPVDNILENTDGRKAMKYMGTTVAPWTVGMSHSFEYKEWALSFTMIGKFGHKFRQTGFNYADPLVTIPNRQYTQLQDETVMPMPDNKFINLSHYSSISPYMDYNVKSANHVRMQELTLSYSLPQVLLRKWGISRLTCYLQGNDLFTIKATDEDPEYAYGGFRLQPTYTIGVKFAY